MSLDIESDVPLRALNTFGIDATARSLVRVRSARDVRQVVDHPQWGRAPKFILGGGSNVLFTGEDAARYGNEHASIVPYQTFHGRDGAFVLAVASEKLWLQTCHVLGREDWLRDPRYVNNAARVKHREALCADMQAFFSGETCAHWLALFEDAGVPCAPINSVRQALDDPVARARGMRVEIAGVPMVGSPLHLSLTPVGYERAPPALGEHSDEIAQHYGMDAAALRAAGAIR